MRSLQTDLYKIEIGPIEDSSLSNLLVAEYSNSKKVIIVDENTHEFCLNKLITNFEQLSEAEVIVLPSGEDSKQIEITYNVWEALTEYNVSRYDLIINLGGGVITDLGGFIASCYKRGIDFINIPTSLLGMVDASIGGKTGINLGAYKNQIGVFSNPVAIYIDTSFLGTLPQVELMSGYAEMLKHGLLQDASLFNQVVEQLTNPIDLNTDLLYECIQVKNTIVQKDPREKAERKLLNLGHTAGHVIEGFFIDDNSYSHGYCVILGILIEAKISLEREILSSEKYNEVYYLLTEHYKLPSFSDEQIASMCDLLLNDKKNKEGKILSCLLNDVGDCIYDQEVTRGEFEHAFKSMMK